MTAKRNCKEVELTRHVLDRDVHGALCFGNVCRSWSWIALVDGVSRATLNVQIFRGGCRI